MPKTRLHTRKGDPQSMSASQGQVAVNFNNGVAEHPFAAVANTAQSLTTLLNQFPDVYELGRPGLATAISADLSAASTITVPAGKFWRVIGGFLQYTASSDVATRTPIVTLQDNVTDDDVTYETFTLSTKTADQVENDHFLVGSDGLVTGKEAVAAQGTLTIAEQVTAGDTFTIGDNTYTFIANGTAATGAFDIEMGSNEAGTKTNIDAKFADGHHPLVTATAFSSDSKVFTARNPGVAGDAIVFVEGTLTHGSNVLDGSGTLGGTTPGVDAANKIATAGLDYPDSGPLLIGGDRIILTTTNGHANDAAELAIFYIEFDNDPR